MKMSVTDLLEKSSEAVHAEQNGDICSQIKFIFLLKKNHLVVFV